MSRIVRKNAVAVGDLLKEFIRASHLTAGLNTRRISAAWDMASGAASCTCRRYFRDGKLYITLSSSVIRSQLQFRKDEILEKMNSALSKDEFFTPGPDGCSAVKEIILK